MINFSKRFFPVTLCLVFLTGVSAARVIPQENFELANRWYLSKDYSEAIKLYTNIIESGYESPEVYYNLGNSYFRVGKLGYSILFYEKALKLAPKDEDTKHNMVLANLRTIDRIETLPEFFLFNWWEGLLNFFSLQELIIAALLFYLILLTAAGIYFFAGSPDNQKKGFISGIMALACLLIIMSIFAVRYNREINEIHGIVISTSSAVKPSPEESAIDSFVVHEGLKVKIEDKVNNWLKIRLIDGKTGWIEKGQIEII